MKKGEEYNGKMMTIIMSIPEDAYKLKVTATVPIDDEPREIEMNIGLSDILGLRKDYLSIDPYDDMWTLYGLTDEYKAFLEECERWEAKNSGTK